MRLADAAGAGFGETEMSDLACGDKVLHRSSHVFHRHRRVNAMLSEHVDVVGAQALERTIDRRADTVRAAVESDRLAVFDLIAELRADQHAIPHGFERFAAP